METEMFGFLDKHGSAWLRWCLAAEDKCEVRSSDQSDAGTSEEEESPLLDLETQSGLSLA